MPVGENPPMLHSAKAAKVSGQNLRQNSFRERQNGNRKADRAHESSSL